MAAFLGLLFGDGTRDDWLRAGGEVKEARSQTVSGEDSAANKLGFKNMQTTASKRGDSLYR